VQIPLGRRPQALAVLRVVGHGVGIPACGSPACLIPSPLAGSFDRLIDWRQLADNVRDGMVSAACVVATSLATGEPVAFVSGGGDGRAGKITRRRFPDPLVRLLPGGRVSRKDSARPWVSKK
jgi:hypothetical protein